MGIVDSIGQDPTRATYLPGGDWGNAGSTNNLPAACNQFLFLQAVADMSAVSLGSAYEVYVPCYYAI